MGWDAHSSAQYDYDKQRFKNPVHGGYFRKAVREVKELAGSVDGYLPRGGLDVDTCAMFLQKATGIDAWGDDLSPEKVREINGKANWEFEYQKEDAWAYWSARKFLEVCAKLNLSIRFSW